MNPFQKLIESQVGAIQENVQKAMAELEVSEVESSVGGGVVRVKMTGVGVLTEIKIDPSVVNADDVELLEGPGGGGGAGLPGQDQRPQTREDHGRNAAGLARCRTAGHVLEAGIREWVMGIRNGNDWYLPYPMPITIPISNPPPCATHDPCNRSLTSFPGCRASGPRALSAWPFTCCGATRRKFRPRRRHRQPP